MIKISKEIFPKWSGTWMQVNSYIKKNLGGLKDIVKIKCTFTFSDWIKCAVTNKENQRKQHTKVLYKVVAQMMQKILNHWYDSEKFTFL